MCEREQRPSTIHSPHFGILMAALRQTAASSLRTVALSSSALSQSAAASAGRRAFAGAAAAARPSLRNRATTPLRSLQQPALRLYSTDKAAEAGDKQGEAAEAAGADGKASEEKLKEQSQALEKREKEIAQLKVRSETTTGLYMLRVGQSETCAS